MLYPFVFTTYQICILFIECSFAFYKIFPPRLYDKILVLCVSRSMCKWIFDILTNRLQAVKVNNIVAPMSINIGATQSCILSPILILNFNALIRLEFSNLLMTPLWLAQLPVMINQHTKHKYPL